METHRSDYEPDALLGYVFKSLYIFCIAPTMHELIVRREHPLQSTHSTTQGLLLGG